MSAPYCSVDECHDTRVSYYGWTGTGTTGGGINRILTASRTPWGALNLALCRIHALERFNAAIGHPR